VPNNDHVPGELRGKQTHAWDAGEHDATCATSH